MDWSRYLYNINCLGVDALKLVTVHLPREFINGLDELVRQRRYPNRSEAIRNAIRDLLKDELWNHVGNSR